MKKSIVVLLVLCTGLVARSQVKFGVKAGLNIADVMTSHVNYLPGTSLGTRTAFNGGLLASIPLSSGFSVQPEISYSSQGQHVSNIVADATVRFNYLNIPVLLKYQFVQGLFVETGPQVGFLLSSKAEANGVTYNLDGIEPVDFTWAFGLGYQLKSIPLGINLRYNLGLTNVYKNSDPEIGKNSVFQFDLFYLLPIK